MKADGSKAYEKHKHAAAEISRQLSTQGRDIGRLPPVKNPTRRKRCKLNFKRFCEIYFAEVFALEWSEDHLLVITIIENSVLNGGLSAVAMPRGSGKSSLCEAAAIWAMIYGHRSWVVLIGASETHAEKALKNIMAVFETNELLSADFPEVVYPIRKLERISKRAQGQLLNGQPTRIEWTNKNLVLPTVPKSAASGARVSVAGITGAIRGLRAVLADGSTIRPDFALIDDPQTRESAQSAKQVRDILSTVNGDILGLAGPGKKMSAVMPCTVIAKGDAADQMLDRAKNPSWQGIRTKLMNAMPTDTKGWEAYAEIWADALRDDGGSIAKATAHYKAHQTALDAGAIAAWPQRFNPDEASAIQHAMNLKLRDEPAFLAEYQNEPMSLETITPLLLTAEKIAAKAIPLKRGIVPSYAQKLTAFIDVQGNILFYCVVAVGDNFSSHVVDYGTYPEQPRNYFFLREVSPTLADKKPGISPEGQLRAGLEALTSKLLTAEFEGDDGVTRSSISQVFIDCGHKGDVVKQFIREAGTQRTKLTASKGYGIKSDARPMETWNTGEGDRRGWNWITNKKDAHLIFDTNGWKTFTAERLAMAVGEAGNLSIFEGSAQQHKMFCDHIASEYPVSTEGQGRTVLVWKERPNRENHWLDCLVGCLVAASEQGIRAVGHQSVGESSKPRMRRRVEVNWGARSY